MRVCCQCVRDQKRMYVGACMCVYVRMHLSVCVCKPSVGLPGCIQSPRWELLKKQRKVEKSKKLINPALQPNSVSRIYFKTNWFFQTRTIVSHDTCKYLKIPCDLKNSSPINPFTSLSSASNTSLSPKPSAFFFWVQSGFGPVGIGVRRFHHSGNSRASSELWNFYSAGVRQWHPLFSAQLFLVSITASSGSAHLHMHVQLIPDLRSEHWKWWMGL